MDNQFNQNNGKATSSLVLGIIGLILVIVGFVLPIVAHLVGIFFSIIGLILGIQARKETPESDQATVGFTLNIIALILNGLILISCVRIVSSLVNIFKWEIYCWDYII